MNDINTVAVDLHEKRYLDFDLLRIAKAVTQDYDGLVTAYLVNVHIHGCSAVGVGVGVGVGVVFSHICPGPYRRFANGRLIRTSDIQSVTKEGRFSVINTVNSKYVFATFRRDVGRRSLREFMRIAGDR
ncbi:hypothetical protein ACIP1X_15380 [Pseudomonas sp. NPDC088885]|uniref:hypothetical protein n=1 Tax=Pseudomonas sp. NPDC088885 TaxID=3364457 RepID=UPI00381919F7